MSDLIEIHESPEDFLAETEELRDAIRELVALYPDLSKPPDAESTAMAELADQKNWLSPDPEYENGWGPEPITLVHAFGAYQFDMAMDSALGIVQLMEDVDFGFIWAPAALLRPVLEGAARSFWLSESGIGTKERLRRGTNDRLEDLFWQTKLGPDELIKISESRITHIMEAASLLGFETQKRLLAPGRPSTTQAIAHLLEKTSDPNFAKIFMMYSSSFVHAGPLALISYAVDPPEDVGQLSTKTLVGLNSQNANIILAGAVAPLVLAGKERLDFNNWTSAEWSDAAAGSLESVLEVIGQYRERLE